MNKMKKKKKELRLIKSSSECVLRNETSQPRLANLQSFREIIIRRSNQNYKAPLHSFLKRSLIPSVS